MARAQGANVVACPCLPTFVNYGLGAQGAAARAAITSGSTVAMFDSGDPERAGVSGRHAVKHAASGRPFRRVVSDAFSL